MANLSWSARRISNGVVALSALVFPVVAAADTPKAVLSLKLVQLKSSEGRVGCTLFDKPEGFPSDASGARQRLWCAIRDSKASCRFEPIPRGTYAVACFHDANGNGKLDKNLLGIPSEGTAASNDARGNFGPPKFEDAKFSFPGTPLELTLRMSY